MDRSGDYVVARVGRAHSLKGEVTVQLHTDEPAARFVPGTTFTTDAPPGRVVPATLTLRSARSHNGTWLLAFEQVGDRTAAESLRGTRLLLGGGARGAPEAPPGSGDAWYEHDLVGLAAVTTQGEPVGTVSGLELGAAQDLLVLKLTGGRTAYIPFVSALVPDVDIEGGRVVIAPPPGLLELND